MDGQSYLNKISQQARPEKKSGGGLSSRLVMILVGIVAAIVVIIAASSILSGDMGGAKNNSLKLKFHIDNSLELINEFQKYVKSSPLRSSSASLASVLSNTSREITTFVVDYYKYNEKSKEYTKLTDAAAKEQDALRNDLFNAKISGTLDRVYAHKFAYEIELMMAEEAKLYKETNNDTLHTILSTSYSSLENLYKSFDDFSESK